MTSRSVAPPARARVPAAWITGTMAPVSAAGVQSTADEYPRPWLDPMPSLRLRGRWLKAAGFDIGARVHVSVEAGKLVVEVESPEQLKS